MVLGLSLTGGGARTAYQAGVLLGLSEIFKECDSSCSFDSYAGVSGGAINMAFCAASTQPFDTCAMQLVDLWSNLQPDHIYKTDFLSLAHNGFRWVRDIATGSMTSSKSARELLDSSPLLNLLQQQIDFSQIAKKIDQGQLNGIACTAYNYSRQKNVSFVQATDAIEMWQRPKRYSQRTVLTAHHLLASAALPIIFKSVQIDGEFYGDGMLRNTAPVSPILHLGCQNVIFIGVSHERKSEAAVIKTAPSIANVFGTLLNSVFHDSLDVDIERVRQINTILDNHSAAPTEHHARKINYLYLKPSQDLSRHVTSKEHNTLPRMVKYLLKGLGESSDLTSYLLFHADYTKSLIELGYDDAHRQKESIVRFLELTNANTR